MITVEEADRLIRRHVGVYPTVEVPFSDIHGRVLRRDLTADRDLPPYNRVTMDGIALVHAAWAAGQRDFPIAGMVKAGEAPLELTEPTQCVEIMTGAVLPESCDCVVPVEALTIVDGVATVESGVHVKPRHNIHPQGSDSRRGDCLVKAGVRLLSPRVAMPASTGDVLVTVDKQPRIALVGTGDELRNIEDEVLPHQIRQTNTHAIRAALCNAGYTDVALHHFPDVRELLLDGLRRILAVNEVVVLSGGVSMGKFDLVPGVLEELGVEGVFHKVRQRPGKPLWFGIGGAGQAVYGLPGNPVSALVSFQRYVMPQLEHSAGLEAEPPGCAVLAEEFKFTKPLTYLLPVRLSFNAEGQLLAIPVPLNGSGDFAGLVPSDGFVELPAAEDFFPAGTIVRLYRWQ